MGDYEVEALDGFGNGVIELDNAIPEKVSDALNSWRRARFTIETTDAGAVAADLLNCRGQRRSDIRIRRNDKTLIWGPITRADANRATVSVQVADPLWHLCGLRFGPVRNLLPNGNGELGSSGWSVAGGAVLEVDASDFARRPQCFKLSSTGTDADAYMGRLLAVSSNLDQPVVFVISGWCKVDAGAWKGPALEERGLYCARLSDPANPRWKAVTAATKQGEWVPFRFELTVPPGSGDVLDLRAYAVKGVIRWGRLKVSVYESTGTPPWPEDAIHPITRVINLAQDPAWGYPPLNITKAGGPTGTLIEIHHQFVERRNVGEELLDYTRKGICDLGVHYPDPSTRTLEVFSPRRGRLLSDIVFDLDPAGSLADVAYAVDGGQTHSAVGIAGPNDEEAFAFDYSLNGGIRRERREDRTDVPIADLEPMADVELARGWEPVRIPTFTTHQQSGDLVERLNVGDTAPTRLDHGCIWEDSVRRIVAWDLDCRTDTLQCEVNA